MHAMTALIAADGDTYLVYGLIALLVVVGLAMAGVTLWLVRVTKPEHDSLAALGAMATRKFRREGTRARQLHLALFHDVPVEVEGPAEAVAGEGADLVDEAEPDEDEDPDTTRALPLLDLLDETAGTDNASELTEARGDGDHGDDDAAVAEAPAEDSSQEPAPEDIAEPEDVPPPEVEPLGEKQTESVEVVEDVEEVGAEAEARGTLR